MNVWKIASRWNDNGENNEDDKLLPKFNKFNIVFAGRNTKKIRNSVQKDDIIAITDGITVKAIAIAKDRPKTLIDFGIDDLLDYKKGTELTVGIDVKIYNLSEKDFFEYTRGTFNEVHEPFKSIVETKLKEILIKNGEIYFGSDATYKLKNIAIENYKGVKNLTITDIPSNTQWIFFTGTNGYGKTTILQAIAEGLYLNKENIQITLQNLQNNQLIKCSDYKKFNNFADYGPYRIKFDENSKEKIKPTEGIFGISEIIFNFEERFKEMQGIEKLRKLRKNIILILKELIPNLFDIQVVESKDNFGTTKVIYIEKDENGEQLLPVSFKQLAMGMRSIIGFCCDMIVKLFENQPDISDFKSINGLVIIDEFDNHLHPKLQRLLVEKLTQFFPKVQFIVSTHSEIPLLGAPKNAIVIKVNRTKKDGITCEKLDINLSELTPENILSSPIFDFQEVIPDSYQIGTRLRTEKNYDEVVFYKILETKIERLAKEKGLEYKKLD